jgi:hypothetical protein
MAKASVHDVVDRVEIFMIMEDVAEDGLDSLSERSKSERHPEILECISPEDIAESITVDGLCIYDVEVSFMNRGGVSVW